MSDRLLAMERRRALVKQAEAARRSLLLRDIAPLPEAQRPRAAAKALANLRSFLERYFKSIFSLPFCDDHVCLIEAIESAARHGGLLALALPRGSGKTSILRAACLWALFAGLRRFVVLISAAERHRRAAMSYFQAALSAPATPLAEEFPEVCYPFQRLQGMAQRQRGQLYDGQPTNIRLGQTEIIFPAHVPRARNPGATLLSVGASGAVRGLVSATSAGEVLRPDLILVDDLQTQKSTASPSQTTDLLALVRGTLLGLSGPNSTPAVLVAGTICAPDDVMAQLTDPARCPEWRSLRRSLVRAWPTNKDKWEEYRQHWLADAARGLPPTAALKFYRQHRAEMDAGAEVAWPRRFDRESGEISAIQHAYDLLFRVGREAFAAEYQNAPELPADEVAQLQPTVVASRLSFTPRGHAPADTELLTAFVDIGDVVLHWVVIAWRGGGGGVVIDYGLEPPQVGRSISRPLRAAYPGLSRDARLRVALQSLCEKLLLRDWRVGAVGGAPRLLDRLGIDAGWAGAVVKELLSTWGRGRPILPVIGKAVALTSRPMSAWPVAAGDRVGPGWRIAAAAKVLRHVLVDSNHWRSHVRDQLVIEANSPAALRLFGDDAAAHGWFAEHLCAERSKIHRSVDRTVEIWEPRPMHENHWWDGVVGAAVLASVCGFCFDVPTERPPPAKRKTLRELQDAAVHRGALRPSGSAP